VVASVDGVVGMTLHPLTVAALALWAEMHPDATHDPDPRQRALDIEIRNRPVETGNTGDHDGNATQT
jgi:hypothetical protein